jgi:hypothetical protein
MAFKRSFRTQIQELESHSAVCVVAALAAFLLTVFVPTRAAAQTRSCATSPVVRRFKCDPAKDEDVPADPVRILADICPSGSVASNTCEGRFGIPTGSGGAQVLSFHTLKFVSALKKFRVEWQCPDWPGQVRVVVRIGDYVAGLTSACGAGHIEWPIERFRTYRIRRAKTLALVEVWTGNSPCRIPIHLLAHLTVPEGLYQPDETRCAKATAQNVCLTVASNFAKDLWEVGLDGVLLESGRGRMGPRQFLIRKPDPCEPNLLSVDFDRASEAKPTWIDEIRF